MRLWPRKKYITARAVILRDNKLLAFHRKRYHHGTWVEYYSIPGGRLEQGESPEIAVVRELQEEMGVEVAVKGLVGHYNGTYFEHYIYASELLSGEPHLMEDSEEAMDHRHNHNQYEVVWVDVKSLSPENLKFYGMFYNHIVAISEGKDIDDVADMTVPNHVY